MDIKKAIIKKLYKLVAKEYKRAGSWDVFPHHKFRGDNPMVEAFVWESFKVDDEEDMFLHIIALQDAGISGDFSYLNSLSRKSIRRILIDSTFRLAQYYFNVSILFELIEKANRGTYILEDLILLDW